MTTYERVEHSGRQSDKQQTNSTNSAVKRVLRPERGSWRTSTAPAAFSMAMLTGLAMAIALGFRELVRLAMSIMGA